MPVDLPETLRLHALWLDAHPDGRRADLRGVNLSGVNLSGVNLSDADLSNAYLHGADLSNADLSGVNLRGVNLSGVNLRGVNLSGVNLSCVKLSGVIGLPVASDFQERLKAVAQQVLGQPDCLNMDHWHSECGTTHCLAGWAIQQAGPAGKILEKLHGPYLAGLLLLGTEAANHFYDSKLDVINWLTFIQQEA
jgi:hypothetical protein